MKALVIIDVSNIQLVHIHTDRSTPPPRDYRIFRRSNPMEVPKEPTSPSDFIPLEIVDLPAHWLIGFPVDYAFWPKDWLDEWGVKEVCKYFGYEYEETDYGTSDTFVPGSDGMASDLDLRSPMRMDIQRPETSPSGPSQENGERSDVLGRLQTLVIREIES